jgi:hypothetical protein
VACGSCESGRLRRGMDPERIRERWLELQDKTAVAAMRARCEAATVGEREADFNRWAYAPRPYPRAHAGEDPRRGRGQKDARLGLDADGRPTFQHLRDDLFQLFEWHDDGCDVFEFHGGPRELSRYTFENGVLVEEVSVDGVERLDGRPRVDVTRWSYEEGRPVLALATNESGAHRSYGGPERGRHGTGGPRRTRSAMTTAAS